MTNTAQILQHLPESLAELSIFDEVIDVRSASEFAEDHLPGAVNLPMLEDSERAEVGTLYVQTGAFPARRLGAAMVSANIARHFSSHFAAKDREYRPLIYCWRGGQRSASLATVLAAVGWRVTLLRGGYKTYRTYVRERLDVVPCEFEYHVVGGATGTAKTQLLHRLASCGAQALDLEGLANHRGSALGHMGTQPTQKMFESLILAKLSKFDPALPVWVEAESNRIGSLYVPPKLWAGMKAASGIKITMPIAGRVAHLLAEYQHYVADPGKLVETLRQFAAGHGGARLRAWEELIIAGRWTDFVASLLEIHYDPRYATSAIRCFANVTQCVTLESASVADLDELARKLHAATPTRQMTLRPAALR